MTLRHIISPQERRSKLKRALENKRIIRGIEVHNAIGALIVNDIKVEVGKGPDKKTNEFDFFWESSLTDSASKGHPDIEIISFDSRIKTISEILEVTDKPLIMDGDTGGDIHHFEYLIPKLERIGVSAIIIEDKVFPKRNSLLLGASQTLEDPDRFAEKIKCGKQIQKTEDFMIIARIESLISGQGEEDALMRARKYLEAGADGIMIHSRSEDPEEIFKFAEKYEVLCKELNLKKPLISVPTTYSSVYELELAEKGFNIVIYANHMLRAAYKAMQDTGRIILENERALEAEPYLVSVDELFEKVGFLDVKEKDELLSLIPTVIIPAAGENPELKHLLGDIPKALLKVNDKTILEHEISLFRKAGLNDINVIIGYQKEKFKIPGVTFFENNDYQSTGMLESLMKVRDKMKRGFILANSDLLFDERLIKELLSRKEDIVIVVDDSYLYHKHELDKRLDAVITKRRKQKAGFSYQKFRYSDDEVISIGKEIPKEKMDYEFVGIVKFSKKGAENFIETYDSLKSSHSGPFHGAETFQKSMDIEMLQELVNRGFKVSIHETHGGWIEIHNERDIEIAKDMLRL